MASPRNHVVRNGETATYHVWSRCVRRDFLCGADPYTGRNFDYRRTWIVKLLEHLAGTFAVNVVNYNVLSNHEHLIASTHPEVARNWSDEEVAWRWKSAWAEWDPEKEVWIARPSDAAIRELLTQPDKVAKARENLSKPLGHPGTPTHLEHVETRAGRGERRQFQRQIAPPRHGAHCRRR